MNKFVRFDASVNIKLDILLLKSNDHMRVRTILQNEIESLLHGVRGIRVKGMDVEVVAENKDPSEMSAEEIMKEIEGVK